MLPSSSGSIGPVLVFSSYGTKDRPGRQLPRRHSSIGGREGVQAEEGTESGRVGPSAERRGHNPSRDQVFRGRESHAALPSRGKSPPQGAGGALPQAREVTLYLSLDQILQILAAQIE